LEDLITKFKDIFVATGRLRVYHHIDAGEICLTQQSLRRLQLAKQKEVGKMLDM
jgi:hypothetical protein